VPSCVADAVDAGKTEAQRLAHMQADAEPVKNLAYGRGMHAEREVAVDLRQPPNSMPWASGSSVDQLMTFDCRRM
jgi:hypothetical protein